MSWKRVLRWQDVNLYMCRVGAGAICAYVFIRGFVYSIVECWFSGALSFSGYSLFLWSSSLVIDTGASVVQP